MSFTKHFLDIILSLFCQNQSQVGTAEENRRPDNISIARHDRDEGAPGLVVVYKAMSV